MTDVAQQSNPTVLPQKDSFLRVLADIAVPGSPARLSRDDAPIGLSFLETALRLNHVRRITETLTLSEHGAATRSVEMDIGIGLLDSPQLEAGMLFALRRHADGYDNHTRAL